MKNQPAIKKEYQVANKTSLMPSQSGRECAVAHFEFRRIKDSSEEEIKQVLRYVMVLLGIRKEALPEEFEKRIMLDFIYKHYKHFTVEEIKLAFEYAICGKLDISATVYQNFNTEYLAKVLNAYKRFIEKNKTFTEYLDEQETLPKLVPSPKQQMQEIMSSFLMNYQKVIQEGYEIQSLYLQEIYFERLEQLGIIEIDLEHKVKIYQYEYKKAKRLLNKEEKELRKGKNENSKISEILNHISKYRYNEVDIDSVEDKLMRKAQLLSRASCFQEWLRFHVEENQTSYKTMEENVSKKIATF